jgi:hypothetical protein
MEEETFEDPDVTDVVADTASEYAVELGGEESDIFESRHALGVSSDPLASSENAESLPIGTLPAR